MLSSKRPEEDQFGFEDLIDKEPALWPHLANDQSLDESRLPNQDTTQMKAAKLHLTWLVCSS